MENTISWINPVAISLGPINIYWYGLMYLLAFITAFLFLKYSHLGKRLPLDENQKDNLLLSTIIGIILGGRLGYILFYNLAFYLENPAKMIAIWEGGMSFHGGMIGAISAIILYSKYRKKSADEVGSRMGDFFQIGDLAALITPLGILYGRLGNFINAELYGRISPSGNYCINFPTDPQNCRFPSQLFEAAGEGLIIFIALYVLSKKTQLTKTPGRLGSVFLILYGLIRTLIEFTREPDAQIGYLLGGPGFFQGLSMGQILSLLTALAGTFLLLNFKKHTTDIKM